MADTTKENTAFETRLSQLESTVNALKSENKALKTALNKSATKSEQPPKPVTPTDQFTVGGRKYVFTGPQFRYRIGGTTELITAKDALASEDILADLVAKGSGIIKEIR